MGAGVSDWTLARAVSRLGQLGVVSGTALDSILARRLQDGDPGGHFRRAIAEFPVRSVADEILDRFFLPKGREGQPYVALPMYNQVVKPVREQLAVLANFVEVWLAKEGHDGVVGVNLLTKIQTPNLSSLYGAILAGVDAVLMGAGIPREIPGVLDGLARHEPVSMTFDVVGLERGESELLEFDPRTMWDGEPPPVRRPYFLPIVASNSLATMMARKATGAVNGFIIEGPTAGGHNAPPRGPVQLNEEGEPIYGERDVVDLDKLRELELPFWIAGGAGRPGRLKEMRDRGAAGIQVGTLFAYCRESGLEAGLKADIIRRCREGTIHVKTDARASPTGFPFKTVQLETSHTAHDVYERRTRVCDLGYLRTAFRMESGRVGYRCPSEPVPTFLKKGGCAEDVVDRRCLCNALMANIGFAQVRKDGVVEDPLVTSGDDLMILGNFLNGRESYSAADVIEYLQAD
jgi:NAD(P)H-dependent flavin oxidoreductase YrpB (nitropropane dioxygenase family)